eukprot:scaffold421301_cov52-Attheya_sp.AAC.11
MVVWGSSLLLGRASVLAFLASSPSAVTRQVGTSPFHTTTSLSAMQYLLKYEYIPDVLEKRGPYREGHLNLAKKLIEEGKCLSGGPTGEPGVSPPTGALFIFTEESAAEAFVAGDPYVSNGIVTGHTIEEWNVVVQKE